MGISIAVAATAGCDPVAFYNVNGRLVNACTGAPAGGTLVAVERERRGNVPPAVHTEGYNAVTDGDGRFAFSFVVGSSWLLFTPPPVEVAQLVLWVHSDSGWHAYAVPVSKAAQRETSQGSRSVRLPEVRVDGVKASVNGTRLPPAGIGPTD